MLKILNITIFTIFLLVGASVEARDQDITVLGKPLTLATWSKAVTKKLEQGLRYPVPMGNERAASGIVSVRFHCSSDGSPGNVVLYHKSGDRSLDLAAMRAVSRIKTLNPMPANLNVDQQYQANILFATSQDEYNYQLARMRKEAARSNAWFSDGGRTIALNVGFEPIGQ